MKTRFVALFLVFAMFLVLLCCLTLFINQGIASIAFPFGIDYGEGIVWQQILSMPTSDAYGPINHLPSIVFHYTPVYHSFVLGIASITNWDMLAIGRTVSIFSTLIIAVFIAALVNRAAPTQLPRQYRLLISASSGLIIFSVIPIFYWAQLMRVDMLALLFSLCGFFLGLKSLQQPKWIYIAAIFFVLAIYTKQNTIAAPLALFCLMLWLNPKLAIAGIGACLALGLLGLVTLSHLTDGEFLNHIFRYNINIFDFNRLYIAQQILLINACLIPPTYIALRVGLSKTRAAFLNSSTRSKREIVLSNQSLSTFLAIALYFLFTTPMLLLFAKHGSASNYAIEWYISCSMLIGVALFDSIIFFRNTSVTRDDSNLDLKIRAIGVPALVLLHACAFVFFVSAIDFFNINDARKLELQTLSDVVRASDKPVISDDMVLLIRSGKNVVWEPAIFAH